MDKQSLGDRMKNYYENVWKIRLPMRMPVILRLDGKTFHTLTAHCDKPFDRNLMHTMDMTALYLCEKIQGAQIAYIQSDEINILLHNYKRLNSDAWFDNELQKMVSVAAGMASACFTINFSGGGHLPRNEPGEVFYNLAVFDSRAFVLPENEVCNYFLWRQTDWERNSIQMLSQSLYSHKELHGKNMIDMQEMCFQKGKNWNDLPTELKRGRCVVRQEISVDDTICIPVGLIEQAASNPKCAAKPLWDVDNEIPIFSQDRGYIEKHLAVEQE